MYELIDEEQEKKERKQKYSDINSKQFKDWLSNINLLNQEQTYNRIAIIESDYCIQFCYRYPLSHEKNNITLVLEKTIDPVIFKCELDYYFSELKNIIIKTFKTQELYELKP